MDLFAPYIARLGGPRRVLMLTVGVVAAALVLAVTRWASAPSWVPLFSGVAVESASQMTDKLDQAGITYHLEQGGTEITVQDGDYAKARIAVAKGGMPGGGRPGLELFDQPSWGMTDYTQRINYRRALEGELERTIGKISGIESAQVHLVMHETDSFGGGDQPSEASVVLKTPTEPTDEVVQGVAHLVASSVEGLTSDHVTIVDQSGRLLSQADEPTSMEGLTSRQLGVQREIEDYMRAKVEKILAQVVGSGGVRVQVAAAMNFDKLARTSQTMDPDKQAVSSESKAQITPDSKQGGAGQTNTSTVYDNTKTTESYEAAAGTIKRLTVAVLVADSIGGTATRPTTTPRTAAELAKIDTLVRSAVGADTARGDIVSVVSVPFAAPPIAATASTGSNVIGTIQSLQRPALGLLGLLLAFAVAFIAVRSFTKGLPAREPMLALPAPDPLANALPAPIVARNGIRDRVGQSIEGQPDVAARVVRAWLKEG